MDRSPVGQLEADVRTAIDGVVWLVGDRAVILLPRSGTDGDSYRSSARRVYP